MEGDLAASWGQEVFVKNTWNRTGDCRELGTQVSGTRGHFDAHWQTGKYLKDFIFALSSQKMNYFLKGYDPRSVGLTPF